MQQARIGDFLPSDGQAL